MERISYLHALFIQNAPSKPGQLYLQDLLKIKIDRIGPDTLFITGTISRSNIIGFVFGTFWIPQVIIAKPNLRTRGAIMPSTFIRIAFSDLLLCKGC